MRANAEVAEQFRELSTLMELAGESRFRVGALQRVARTLESLTDDVVTLAGDPGQLESLDGVGTSSAEKIRHWCEHGVISDLEAWRAKVPPGLIDVLSLPGAGPVLTRTLWKEGGITDPDTLRIALREGTLTGIKGLGERTLSSLDAALRAREAAAGHFRIGRALPAARALTEALRTTEGVRSIELSGALRRGCETVRTIDLVAAAEHPDALITRFRALTTPVSDASSPSAAHADPAEGESPDDPATTLVVSGLVSDGRSSSVAAHIRVDLVIAKPAFAGAAHIVRTGPASYVEALNRKGRASGDSIRIDGLFAGAGDDPVSTPEEEDVCARLGLPYIPAELRERADDPSRPPPPDLIRIEQITADLHTHTTASDGHLSLRESVAHARQRGLRVLAVTDHSQSSVQAHGLSRQRLRNHIRAIRAYAAQLEDFMLLAGAEVDILPDGSLDYDDETLALLDIVVASPHASLRQDPDIATERILRAIRHPAVDIIGHPTGRIIQRRAGLPLDIPRIAREAGAHGVALEINANPLRLDLRDSHVAAALAEGALIAVNTDMHGPAQFAHLEYGVLVGRRGGLPCSHCVNAWAPTQLSAWLSRRRGRDTTTSSRR